MNGDDVLQVLLIHNSFHGYGVSQLKEEFHLVDIILSFISLIGY
jgi:hypothetical protein